MRAFHSKCRGAESFEACYLWALLNVQIASLLFSFTVLKNIYPSVIILVGYAWEFEILNVQVNGPLPKSGWGSVCVCGGGGGGGGGVRGGGEVVKRSTRGKQPEFPVS